MPTLSKKRRRFTDFHPLRKSEQAVSTRALAKWIDECKLLLPDSLTESEIEERWQDFRRKLADGRKRSQSRRRVC